MSISIEVDRLNGETYPPKERVEQLFEFTNRKENARGVPLYPVMTNYKEMKCNICFTNPFRLNLYQVPAAAFHQTVVRFKLDRNNRPVPYFTWSFNPQQAYMNGVLYVGELPGIGFLCIFRPKKFRHSHGDQSQLMMFLQAPSYGAVCDLLVPAVAAYRRKELKHPFDICGVMAHI